MTTKPIGFALAVSLFVASAAMGQDALSIDELAPGQRGYGLSVFAGSEPERFDVEVIGVMRNVNPGTSFVLVELSGQGLEESGVVAGMSGSPVYIDDRLVGAVAFSWIFAERPVAGVTPIAVMREIGGGGGRGAGRSAPEIAELLEERDSRGALEAELAALRPRAVPGAQSAIGWGASGFGAESQAFLASTLGGLAPMGWLATAGEAGSSALPGDEELPAGSSVAAVLIDGDLRLAATGTVTERHGDDVLAFGHSFFELGEIEVPMARSEVLTVLSNQMNSFKIANVGEVVGAFQQDRSAGVRGRVGARAATIPLTVEIRGTVDRSYEMRLADIPQLTPALTAVAVLGAQSAASQTVGSLGLDLEVSFDLGEPGVLELSQSFDGDSAVMDAVVYLLSFARFLVANSYADVTLDGIHVEIVQHPAPRSAVIVGGYADRIEVKPGERVNVYLELVPYRGEPVRRQVSVQIPVAAREGRYSVLVGDGVSVDVARLSLEPAAPVSFDQVLELLRRFHSRRELVALGVFQGPGLVVRGEVMPQLPGSIRSVWRASSSPGAVPLAFTVDQELVEPMDVPLQGGVRIDLRVLRKAPSVPGAEESGESGETGEGAEAGSGEGGGE